MRVRARFPCRRLVALVSLALSLLLFPIPHLSADPFAADLPQGVQAVWDTARAFHETTPTRERICLNGLWRWQPAEPNAQRVPSANWGFFKVPDFWPGASSYIQEDSQSLHVHPSWKNADVRNLGAAWYQREFTVPADWTRRRIALVEARIRAKQNNLVEKDRTNASPGLGTGSTGHLSGAERASFEQSSTGTESIPSL